MARQFYQKRLNIVPTSKLTLLDDNMLIDWFLKNGLNLARHEVMTKLNNEGKLDNMLWYDMKFNTIFIKVNLTTSALSECTCILIFRALEVNNFLSR